MSELNQRQARFVEEYLTPGTEAYGNATQAAIRAGYSPRTAKQQGNRLLTKAHISRAVAKRREKMEKKLVTTRDEIAAELYKLAFANMADYIRVSEAGDAYVDLSEMTRDQAAAVTEITVEDFMDGRGEGAREVRRVKFKLESKRLALMDLAKLLGYADERIIVEAAERLRESERSKLLRALQEANITAEQVATIQAILQEADAANGATVH